jgi:hypothetical protein
VLPEVPVGPGAETSAAAAGVAIVVTVTVGPEAAVASRAYGVYRAAGTKAAAAAAVVPSGAAARAREYAKRRESEGERCPT